MYEYIFRGPSYWCNFFYNGCLRRTVPQQPPPPPTPEPTHPPMAAHHPTYPAFDHKQPCTIAEVYRTRCLNGGSCIAIELNNGLRDIGCSCTADWVGDRCQYVFIDPDIQVYDNRLYRHRRSISSNLQPMHTKMSVQQENMRTANIAAGVSVCILVMFVLLLSVYVYLRYKRKERLLQDFENSDGNERYSPDMFGRRSLHNTLHETSKIQIERRVCNNNVESEYDGMQTELNLWDDEKKEKSCTAVMEEADKMMQVPDVEFSSHRGQTIVHSTYIHSTAGTLHGL